jgi:hypothetical protein
MEIVYKESVKELISILNECIGSIGNFSYGEDGRIMEFNLKYINEEVKQDTIDLLYYKKKRIDIKFCFDKYILVRLVHEYDAIGTSELIRLEEIWKKFYKDLVKFCLFGKDTNDLVDIDGKPLEIKLVQTIIKEGWK